MAWTASKVNAQFVLGALDRTVNFDLDTDAFLVALYNNSITPDQTVALASTAYNVAQWATANELYEAGQWAQGGASLVTPDVTTAGTTIMWDAPDTASGAAADLAAVYGCLVYDNTLAGKYGVCYNYFGGSNSVVNGTFTIVWSASGIASFSVA